MLRSLYTIYDSGGCPFPYSIQYFQHMNLGAKVMNQFGLLSMNERNIVTEGANATQYQA
jgi:hypothetical protein